MEPRTGMYENSQVPAKTRDWQRKMQDVNAQNKRAMLRSLLSAAQFAQTPSLITGHSILEPVQEAGRTNVALEGLSPLDMSDRFGM